uniref:uncharacterized protein n=1 Tax=Centroberyx gerrardi TaxID=166262 RepID=UPI003AAE612A
MKAGSRSREDDLSWADRRADELGQTWTHNEVTCLLNIWAEENIAQLLEKVHKNTKVFKIFCDKMKEKVFQRTIEQCRVKVNTTSKYTMICKSGSSSDIKDKFVWYDYLDWILGDTAADLNKDSGQPSAKQNKDQSQQPGKTWAIPGAPLRKRIAKSGLDSRMLEYMAEQRKKLNAMMEAEHSHHQQESATFESFLQAQQEAEERRFKALQVQNQENNRTIMNAYQGNHHMCCLLTAAVTNVVLLSSA